MFPWWCIVVMYRTRESVPQRPTLNAWIVWGCDAAAVWSGLRCCSSMAVAERLQQCGWGCDGAAGTSCTAINSRAVTAAVTRAMQEPWNALIGETWDWGTAVALCCDHSVFSVISLSVSSGSAGGHWVHAPSGGVACGQERRASNAHTFADLQTYRQQAASVSLLTPYSMLSCMTASQQLSTAVPASAPRTFFHS